MKGHADAAIACHGAATVEKRGLAGMKRGEGAGPWPYLCLVLATLCWAGNFILGRAMNSDIPPVALNFWRWSLACILLLPFTMASIWRQRQTIKEHAPILVLLAVTGVSAFNTLVYLSLHTTSSINAALMIAAVPLMVPTLSFLINGTAVTPAQVAGTAVSLAGALVLITKCDMDKVMALEFVKGDILMLVAAMVWSLYTVLLARRPRQIDGIVFLNTITIIGLLVLLPFYLMELAGGAGFRPSLPNLATIVYVALFATITAFVAWNHAVARIGPNRAGLFIHCLPLFTAILAIVLLGEGLYGYHIVGAGLVGLGIYLSARPSAGRREGDVKE